MFTKDQFDKLPLYVKSEIARLRQENENLRAEVAWRKDEDRIKVAASNTSIVEGIEHHTAIKPFSEVEFCLEDPGNRRVRSSISVRLRRDGRSVEVMGSAGNALVISPQVSNVIHVTLRDD